MLTDYEKALAAITGIALTPDARDALNAEIRRSARCAGVTTDTFFPTGDDKHAGTLAAQARCGGCTVAAQCLTVSVSRNHARNGGPWGASGVWGGCDEHERGELHAAAVRLQRITNRRANAANQNTADNDDATTPPSTLPDAPCTPPTEPPGPCRSDYPVMGGPT